MKDQIASSVHPSTENPGTESSHTPGHVDCPVCNEHRLKAIEPAAYGSLAFHQAAPIWLEDRRAEIAPKTYSDYQYYIRYLNRFFGLLPLNSIHIGHLKAYAEERAARVGRSCINHELNTLKQILRRAGLWNEIAKFYRPLKLGRPQVGQAMEQSDEELLFETAASRRRWKVAYWCSIITATTTAGPKEISHLHVNDIDLAGSPGAPYGTVRVRDGLKNGYRERIIPLNEASSWALEQILDRYREICRRLKIETDPEHYILPGRGRTTSLDPRKPVFAWRKAWRALRKAADMPKLRMYDLRHHAITKLMEDPEISEQTVEDMAGHALSSKMKKRYSHIRMKPKQEATAKLELRLPPKG